MTLTEAAEYLGRSRQGVHYLISKGTLPAERIPSKLNIGGNKFYYDIKFEDLAALKGAKHANATGK